MPSSFRTIKQRLLFIGIAAWGMLFVACTMVDRSPPVALMSPPQIPGATFVGSESCAKCHSNISGNFHDATHAKIKLTGDNGKRSDISCESCHGPASGHIAAGAPNLIVKGGSTTCFQCHTDKQGEFRLPHAHPVLSGKMNCSDCHDPHKADALPGSARQLASANANATCVKCHTAQSGPFVFEHEAMREGCVACHSPHGSVNDKMLKTRTQALCTSCHFQQQTNSNQILYGGADHTAYIQRGTCWTAGCHEQPHGSHVNSSLRF